MQKENVHMELDTHFFFFNLLVSENVSLRTLRALASEIDTTDVIPAPNINTESCVILHMHFLIYTVGIVILHIIHTISRINCSTNC